MGKEWKAIADKPLKIIDILIYLFVIGTILFLICYWKYIPEKVPQHWNGAGVIDDYADAGGYIMLVIMMCFFLMWHSLSKIFPAFIANENLFGKKQKEKATEEDRKLGIRLIFYMLWCCDLLLEGVFAYIIVCGVLVRNLGAWFLPAVIVVLAADFVWFFWKLYRLNTAISDRE